MNENEIYVVKEYNFEKALITKIDSIIDCCYRDCHNKYFHNFKYKCIYGIKLTNITDNETINLRISVISMNLFKLDKELKGSKHNGFIFIQINKLTIKFFSLLRYINISSHIKFPMPMCHRQFFRIISQNREYINNFRNDMEYPFPFACQKWFNQLN